MNSAGPTPPVERFAVLPAFDGPQPEIRVYQLARPAIQFLTSLVEAAEGIGLVRTLDEQRVWTVVRAHPRIAAREIPTRALDQMR